MSKIKDELERIRELEFEQYVSFMEWMCDQKEVSESCSIEEEESHPIEKPSTTGTSIVPTNTLRAVNNRNYNPNRSIK